MAKVNFKESQEIEFKRSFSSADRWLEQGTSFVNTDGGEIYFGIEDDGEVVGIVIPQHKADNIQQSFSNLEEPITIQCEEKEYFGKTVFVVKIPKGHKIPHFLSGTVHIRTGAITRTATKEEITKMIIDAGYIQFEKQPIKNALLSDIDEIKLQKFLEKKSRILGNEIPKNTIENNLVNLGAGIIEEEKFFPTTTGILFFGKNPQEFVAYNRVTIARYKGIVPVTFIDKADLIGTIPEIIAGCEQFIKRNTRNSAEIVGYERIEIPEYPIVAIREGVVNAVSHKDYSNSKDPIQVSIFDDRIEITNPGIPDVPTSELEGSHRPRNAIICKLLNDAGYMESMGTGIARMKELMKENGLNPPILEILGNLFKITFQGPKDDFFTKAKPIIENLKEEGLNDRQIKALTHIYKEGYITHKEYCSLFSVSIFEAKKDLDELVAKERISQKGKGMDSSYTKFE